MATVGYASLQIIPSMRGVQQSLTSQISGPAAVAGKTGGAKMGAALKAGVLATGAGAAAVGAVLFKVGSEFDKMSDTIRVGTGATGESLKNLEGVAKNVGRTTPSSFEDIGTAVADLNTRLGLTGKPLQDRAKQFLDLSRITGTDVTTNIKTVTRAFGDWEVSTGKQSSTLDMFFRAAQSSGATVDELAQQVVQFGAPLRQVGFSLEESTAMFANFERAGVNTQTMMPGIKMAMKRFFEKGIDPKKGLTAAFEGIQDGSIGASEAIDIFGSRAGGDMIEAVQQGRFNLDEMTESLMKGKETVRSASDDTNDFAESWQVFKNRAMLAVEPIAKRFFDMLSTAMAWVASDGIPTLQRFAEKVRQFGAFLQRNATPIKVIAGLLAAVLIPHYVAVGVAATKTALIKLRAWLKMKTAALRHGASIIATIARIIAKGAVWVAKMVAQSARYIARWALMAARSGVHAIRMAAAWTIGVVRPAGKAIATMVAQSAVFVARWVFMGAKSLLSAAKVALAWIIAMGPIALVIAAVVGLVVLVVKNWDKILAFTKRVWAAITDWVVDKARAIRDWVVRTFTGLRDRAVALFRAIGEGISNAVQRARDWVVERFTALRDGVVSVVTALRDRVVGFFTTLRERLSTAAQTVKSRVIAAFTNLKDGAISLARRLLDFITGMPGRIVRGLGNLGSTLLQAGKDLIGGLIRGATEFIKDIPGKIADAAKGIGSSLLKGLASLNPFGDGPGSGGSTLDRVKAMLPQGAYVTSTYRTPAANAAAGGSPTSYHMDRNNPAVDIGGSTSVLDRLYMNLRAVGGWRELLWRVKGHFDHIHVADQGGVFQGPGYVWMGAGQETFASGLAATKVADLPAARAQRISGTMRIVDLERGLVEIIDGQLETVSDALAYGRT